MIAADADTLLELTSGAMTAADALARGARIDGAPEAIECMRAVLPSRHEATSPEEALT